MYKAGPLSDLLGKLFDLGSQVRKAELPASEYERRRFDFCFHMSDWDGDLHRLSDLFNHPDSMNEQEALMLVMGFLYHAVPHINAAGRLLLDEIPDPFSGGAGGPDS